MFGVQENKTKQLFGECKYLKVNSTEILVSGDPGKTVVSLGFEGERAEPPEEGIAISPGLGLPPTLWGLCSNVIFSLGPFLSEHLVSHRTQLCLRSLPVPLCSPRLRGPHPL